MGFTEGEEPRMGRKKPTGSSGMLSPLLAAGVWSQSSGVLRQTFCHVPGVGIKAEERLWASGVVSWDALGGAVEGVTPRKREQLTRHVEESRRQLAERNPLFFAETMPLYEIVGACAHARAAAGWRWGAGGTRGPRGGHARVCSRVRARACARCRAQTSRAG
jgi:hypothetical protein